MDYFKTNNKVANNLEGVNSLYNKGYVLTRLGKFEMIQTRSLRINLNEFRLNSENKRILNKNRNLKIEFNNLPLKNYNWEIHKLGKDFYTNKFGDGTMSASKIKEMFNEMNKSNMNGVFTYTIANENIGYCLCFKNSEFIHYAYPFYDLKYDSSNIGMGMMIKAIVWAKDINLKYIYLGSVTDNKARYKLQFKGLEWWNTTTNVWETDIKILKNLLDSEKTI